MQTDESYRDHIVVTPLSSPQITSTPKKAIKRPTNKSNIQRGLKVINVNCRSIRNKKAEFENLIHTVSPDIVVGTESWLTSDILDSEVFPVNLGYNVFRRDRDAPCRGGGVFILVSKLLTATRAPELETDCELLWVKIETEGSKPLYVGAYYKPEETDEHSVFELKSYLSMLTNSENIIWLFGDFNMPKFDRENNNIYVNCKSTALYECFQETIQDNNLHQMVNFPTRGNNSLDLYFTNRPSLVSNVILLPGLSDHDVVYTESTLKPQVSKYKPRTIHLFKKADWDSFRQYMSEYKDHILSSKHMYTDVETLWCDVKNKIHEGIKTFVPSIQSKEKNKLPWINIQLKRLIRKRDKLFYRQRQTRKVEDIQKYKQVKHLVQQKTRLAYNVYVENILGVLDSQVTDMETSTKQTFVPKKLFTFLKHTKRDSCGVSPLKDGGTLHSDAVSKGNILNNQFQSVFSPRSPLSLKQLCELKVGNTNSLHSETPAIMPELEFCVNGIGKLLKNLKPEKAAGPDHIPPIVLKELYIEVSPVLEFLFQLSYDTGTLPREWCTANVSPLFKKGDRSKPANYRPISLTCILCKTFEHIITSNLVSHFSKNNILYELQHGFREKRSCETQLLMLVDELARNIQHGKQTDLVLLDFSKAFDKVSHDKLCYKLHQLGVQGRNLAWIRGFLSNRTQKVIIDGECSSSIPVTSGVPQGSVLGPILFLAYINDLPAHIQSQVRLFADDTVVYVTLDKVGISQTTLQEDLKRLEHWETLWDMEFNPSKCQVVHVSTSKCPVHTDYILHGHVLETTSAARYLGVDIADNLSWNTHINRITGKANSTLGFLRRNIPTKNRQLRSTAYKAVVRPQLEYAASIWDPYTGNLIRQVEAVQRRAARWVYSDFRTTSSVTTMLNELGWRSLEQRRADFRLTLMYKIVHGLVAVPSSQLVRPIRVSRSSHSFSFCQLQTTKNIYKYSYFPLTIVQWNRLPCSVVSLPKVEQFKLEVSKLYHLRP